MAAIGTCGAAVRCGSGCRTCSRPAVHGSCIRDERKRPPSTSVWRCRSMPGRCTASPFPPPAIVPPGSSCGGRISSAFRRTSKATTSILRLMLVPDSPGTSDVPQGFGRLQRRASPLVAPGTGLAEGMFQPLAVAAQMAFLNIEAKLRETYVDARPLLSFVRGVRHVAVDRLFLFFDAGLEGSSGARGRFAGRAGPRRSGVPSRPARASRQLEAPASRRRKRAALVFARSDRDARRRGPLAGSLGRRRHRSGKGLAHVVEWLENNVFRPGHKTNQSLVYALLYAQGILPVYELDPAPATRVRLPSVWGACRRKALAVRGAPFANGGPAWPGRSRLDDHLRRPGPAAARGDPPSGRR